MDDRLQQQLDAAARRDAWSMSSAEAPPEFVAAVRRRGRVRLALRVSPVALVCGLAVYFIAHQPSPVAPKPGPGIATQDPPRPVNPTSPTVASLRAAEAKGSMDSALTPAAAAGSLDQPFLRADSLRTPEQAAKWVEGR